MKTILVILSAFILTGCGGFWETYGKRSEMSLGFNSTNDVGVGQASKNLTSTVNLRGSNRDIMKAWQEMTSFARESLGLE